MALTSRSVATPCGLDGVQPSRMIKKFSSTFSVPVPSGHPLAGMPFVTPCLRPARIAQTLGALRVPCSQIVLASPIYARRCNGNGVFPKTSVAISLVSLQRVGG